MSPLLKYAPRYHKTMMALWALLAIPTVLWWKESVLWVAFLSLYANFASEFGAWHASGAERKIEEANGNGSLGQDEHCSCCQHSKSTE